MRTLPHSPKRRRTWLALIAAAIATTSMLMPAGASAGSRPSGHASSQKVLPELGPFGIDPSGAPSPSGRVEDMAKDPFATHRYLALSDAALWQSTDDGAHWTHLPGLERFGQWIFEHGTIAFDPLVSGVVLIASPDDRRRPTQVGVYRSTDGGQIWHQTISGQPQCADGSVGSPSVVVFSGHNAEVAGGCSVGRSTDDGQHWAWTTPDSGGHFSGVTIDANGTRFACGSDGIFRQRGATWTQVVDFTAAPWPLGSPVSYGPFGTCRITASPAQLDHVFFAARWSSLPDFNSDVAEAYLNSDHLWSAVDLVGGGHPNGRDVLVQTAPNKQKDFNLYWGTTDAVQFQPCTRVAGQECKAGLTHDESQPNPPWVYFGQGANPHGMHADVTKILFAAADPHCVTFVSDDGGIQKPDASNCDGSVRQWTYSDRGISATEFYETAVTSIEGLGHAASDLYGASQDNDGFVRRNDHTDWTNVAVNGDGYLVAATPVVAASQLSSIRTFFNSNDSKYLGNRGLTGLAGPPAGNTLYTAPCAGQVSRHQIDQTPEGLIVMACVSTDLHTASLYISGDRALSWTPVPNSSVTGRPDDNSGVSVYATKREGGGTGYFVRIGGALWRVTGSAPPTRMTPAWDIGPVAASYDGAHVLTFACPPAPQTCTDGRLRQWSRATNSWQDIDVVTSLLRHDFQGNAFYLDRGLATDGQVAATAIAPGNPNLMAIGTSDVGVLLSGDGGDSWQRVPEWVPNITGATFDQFNRLDIGTYGRGMFGDEVPKPNTLHLSATTTRKSKTQLHVSWSAHLRDPSGANLAGVVIRFTLHDNATDSDTEVGHVTTNRRGIAASARTIPRGDYRLIAQWEPSNSATLITDAGVQG
jgi:hypothetical protein